jgi:hypothetical protein
VLWTLDPYRACVWGGERKGTQFAMLQAPAAEGTCGDCGRRCLAGNRAGKRAKGRCVEDLEDALRADIAVEFICDVCILKMQPISRKDVGWARHRPQRAPLCARNGWECENQSSESSTRHTETLRRCNLSLFRRRNVGIADYARVDLCLCIPCYIEFSKSGNSPTQSEADGPPSAPRRGRVATVPDLETPQAKHARYGRAPGQATPEDLVRVLRLVPDDMKAKIAAVAASLDNDIGLRPFCRLLDVNERSAQSGTAFRASRALTEGSDISEVFSPQSRGSGWGKHNVVALVVQFFVENSVPGNTGKVAKRSRQQYRFLQDAIKRVLLPAFKELHPNLSMSHGTFCAIRRKQCPWIRNIKHVPHAGCRYCDDCRFRLNALDRHRVAVRCGCKAPTYSGVFVKDLICSLEEGDPWWKAIPCALGKCGKCGWKKFESTKPCLAEKRAKRKLRFKAWEEDKDGDHKEWKPVWQESETANQWWKSTQKFCDEAASAATQGWIFHILCARIQHEARRELLSRLPADEVMLGVDWARQYEFVYSYTVAQQSHAVTKASILVFYLARRTEEGVRYETFFFVTKCSVNDQKSNKGILHHGIDQVLKKLDYKPKHVHLFSDGEFRERGTFAWLQNAAKKRCIGFSWNFYAANHGKDLYDGEGGVFKCSARKHVHAHSDKETNPVSNVKELVQFGKDHLTNPSGDKVLRRHFFLLDKPIESPPDARIVVGSNKYYAWHADPPRPGVPARVYARVFSCYCEECMNRTGKCTRPGHGDRIDPKVGYV